MYVICNLHQLTSESRTPIPDCWYRITLHNVEKNKFQCARLCGHQSQYYTYQITIFYGIMRKAQARHSQARKKHRSTRERERDAMLKSLCESCCFIKESEDGGRDHSSTSSTRIWITSDLCSGGTAPPWKARAALWIWAFLYRSRSTNKHWMEPAMATTPDPHHAIPVKPTRAPKLYKYPATGGATVRQAPPALAAKPLIFPKTEWLGEASFNKIRMTGYARMEKKLRVVRHV